MEDFPMQDITIYHKSNNKWDRYVVEASYRNTSITNHNRNGSDPTDNALIRIFDINGYNLKWFVENDDIIVNKKVEDVIERVPLTELSKKYGTQNVHKVTSIDKFIFDDEDLPNHIKIGAIWVILLKQNHYKLFIEN